MKKMSFCVGLLFVGALFDRTCLNPPLNDRDKWRKYVHGVASRLEILGSRTAREQNTAFQKRPPFNDFWYSIISKFDNHAILNAVI